MDMYYSPSAQGFYSLGLHAHIPEDGISLPEGLHETLLDGQSSGLVIAPPDEEHDLPWLDEPPQPTQTQMRDRRKTEIMTELERIDSAAIRPLRAMIQGAGTEGDTMRLAALEAEAAALRAELAALNAG